MYLGIDYGHRNIGLAISEVGIAIPYQVIDAREFFDQIDSIITEKKIQTIVVGIAIGYDAYGKQKKVFDEFIGKLKKVIPDSINIEVQDEDLSTFEAQEALDKLGEKDHVDDVAASIILQRYLDKNE